MMGSGPDQGADENGAAVTEREKWQAELRFRERELALKEAEQRNRDIDQQRKSKGTEASQWRSPLVVAVMAATVAALGNGVVTVVNGVSLRAVEAQKAEAGRILQAIESPNPLQSKANLAFLAETGLITDARVLAQLTSYLKDHPEPGVGPQTISSSPPPATPSGSPSPATPAFSSQLAPPEDELAISQRLKSSVDAKQYDTATALFEPLRQAHFSGVGYSAYPEAAFAFDQLSNEADALRVLDLLAQRLELDGQKGYGYLAAGRPPRASLRRDFEQLMPQVRSAAVRQRMQTIIAKL